MARGGHRYRQQLGDQAPGRRAHSDGRLVEIQSYTLDVRISSGIASDSPRLGPEAIHQGIDAVGNLVAEANGLGADRLTAVATSAVRDAANNQAEFLARAKSAVGLDIRVLSGLEERAALIGRGLMTDLSLAGMRDFFVFDLGGGSLECLSFRDRGVEREASLPLGCVRLTEKFVRSAALGLSPEESRNIGSHVR